MPWLSRANDPEDIPRLIAFEEGLAGSEPPPAPSNPTLDSATELEHDDDPSLVREDSITIATDALVVLDIEHDRLLKLNPVGAEMWKLLIAGNPESSIIESIAQRYKVDKQRVGADFHALLNQIAELGIEIRREPPREQEHNRTTGDLPSFPWYAQDSSVPRPQPAPATVCCAVLGLTFVDLILWMTSIKSLCRVVKAWPLKESRVTDSASLIAQICSAVEMGCVWYPRRSLCLQRSAVTTFLLRSHGIDAHMIIGARPMPFLSHAWVETNGSVVNDWPRVKNVYQRLASY